MSVERAMKVINGAVGPHGGNLNNPVQQPEARRAHFNAALDPETGLPFLHKKDWGDAALCGRQNEQMWHRMAAFMLLAGRTNSEIALAAGVSTSTVSGLRSQRWFQELLAVLANERGQDVLGVLASEALASVEKLVALRDDGASERVQLAAAQTLLEHAAGKPTQKILSISSHTTFNDEKDEMKAIREELEALRSQKTT